MITIAGGIVLAIVFLIVGYFVLATGAVVASRAISGIAAEIRSVGDQIRDPKTMNPIVLFAILFVFCFGVIAIVLWIQGW